MGGCKADRISFRLGVFSPGLHYKVRIARGNDITCRRPFFIRLKAAYVVLMAMRGDYGVKLVIAFRFNIFGNAHHQVFRRLLWLGRGAKVNQHVTVFYLAALHLVLKRQQEAIAEPYLITSQDQLMWLRVLV